MKILAVDDDQISLDILSSALIRTGQTNFMTALSGEDALAAIMASQQDFDIFLLDIQMPEMDGIELCAKIRSFAKYQATPIIMITAMSERKFIDGAFAAGAMDYVSKPFDPLELGVRLTLAERTNIQNKLIESSNSELEYLKVRAGILSDLDPNVPLEIREIPRVIGMVAMENYLLRLNKSMAHQSTSIGFAIEGFGLLHANVSSAELYDILADTSEAIACGLKRTEHLVTYCGNGEFVAVCHRAADLEQEGLLVEVQNTLDSFGVCFANGVSCPLKISQSTFYSPNIWAAMDGTNLLAKPLESLAEQRADQRFKKQPSALKQLVDFL